MTHKIVVLESAEHDLQELRAYIVKNFSLTVWKTTSGNLLEAMRTLKSFPLSGFIPEEIEKLNLSQFRQIIVGMNRIIYEVRQNVIYIHIIVDARRDMKSLLMKRLLRVI